MKIVKDLMVPVDDCGTVHQEETVSEAIQTLQKTRDKQQTHAGAFKRPASEVMVDAVSSRQTLGLNWTRRGPRRHPSGTSRVLTLYN